MWFDVYVTGLLGAVSLSVGIIALVTRQPHHVWYLFTIIGCALTAALLQSFLKYK